MVTKLLTAIALTLSRARVAFACGRPSNMPAHYIGIVFDTDSIPKTH